jgi:hypothetical protein
MHISVAIIIYGINLHSFSASSAEHPLSSVEREQVDVKNFLHPSNFYIMH